MRRWHEEHGLMLRRWKQEMDLHGYDWRNPPKLSCVSDEQGVGGTCHCAAGIGSMRKRTPLDCGNPRCGTCHGEKFYAPKRRGAKRREAIQFDVAAEG